MSWGLLTIEGKMERDINKQMGVMFDVAGTVAEHHADIEDEQRCKTFDLQVDLHFKAYLCS